MPAVASVAGVAPTSPGTSSLSGCGSGSLRTVSRDSLARASPRTSSLAVRVSSAERRGSSPLSVPPSSGAALAPREPRARSRRRNRSASDATLSATWAEGGAFRVATQTPTGSVVSSAMAGSHSGRAVCVIVRRTLEVPQRATPNQTRSPPASSMAGPSGSAGLRKLIARAPARSTAGVASWASLRGAGLRVNRTPALAAKLPRLRSLVPYSRGPKSIAEDAARRPHGWTVVPLTISASASGGSPVRLTRVRAGDGRARTTRTGRSGG